MDLIFSPFAGIQKHRELELKLALKLSQKNRVEFLTCNGVFQSFCVAMAASGLNEFSTFEEKIQICTTCNRLNKMTVEEFDFKVKQASELIDDIDYSDVDNLLRELNQESWINFVYRGVPIGKYGAYDFFLNHKLNSMRIPDELWSQFSHHLRNCMIATNVAFEYFSKYNPSRVFTYNRLYSINRVFCHVAESKQIPTYSIQAAGPVKNYYSRFTMLDDDRRIFKASRSSKWANYSQTRLTIRETWNAASHLRSLAAAKSPWVYSSPSQRIAPSKLRDFLGISESQKVFLITTSSQDEILAATIAGVVDFEIPDIAFNSTQDWIDFVALEVEKRPDWFLIIRPHPREFPNKRENVESQAGQELLARLERFRGVKNIFINSPDQNISIYDLARITTLHLNSTSTVGLEMSLMGVPSLIYSKNLLTAYPFEISRSTITKDEYLEHMESINQVTFIELSHAIKWISFKYFISTHKSGSFFIDFFYWSGNNFRRFRERFKLNYLKGVFKYYVRVSRMFLKFDFHFFRGGRYAPLSSNSRFKGSLLLQSAKLSIFIYRILTRNISRKKFGIGS